MEQSCIILLVTQVSLPAAEEDGDSTLAGPSASGLRAWLRQVCCRVPSRTPLQPSP